MQIVPDIYSEKGKKEQVENMFDNIAGRYDRLNHILSLRIDTLWRKKVRKILEPFEPKKILDIATGTGDLAIELTKLSCDEIIGLDLSAQMLQIAEKKIEAKKLQSKIKCIKGDSENLVFENHSFDAITVAFGVRNFENLEKGLQEIFRVLKPGGNFIILEFSKVKKFPMKQLFTFYFRYITPVIGRIISKNNLAYKYLPNSVAFFPEGEQMVVILKNIGFTEVICKEVSQGIASIYHCKK